MTSRIFFLYPWLLAVSVSEPVCGESGNGWGGCRAELRVWFRRRSHLEVGWCIGTCGGSDLSATSGLDGTVEAVGVVQGPQKSQGA